MLILLIKSSSKLFFWLNIPKKKYDSFDVKYCQQKIDPAGWKSPWWIKNIYTPAGYQSESRRTMSDVHWISIIWSKTRFLYKVFIKNPLPTKLHKSYCFLPLKESCVYFKYWRTSYDFKIAISNPADFVKSSFTVRKRRKSWPKNMLNTLQKCQNQWNPI